VSLENLSPRIREVIRQLSGDERSIDIALGAIIGAADETGSARFQDVAAGYRNEYLRALRAEGRDAEREAGRLGLDEVRKYLGDSIIPRLVGDGVLVGPAPDPDDVDALVRIADGLWREVAPNKAEVAAVLKHTAGEVAGDPLREMRPIPSGSILEAKGLVKTYRRRAVVNDVDLRLQQGEIVGLLGPNGAGKTTTFYMIVGLIEPDAGRILLDGRDITGMPMYQRARHGIGYLSQEPSVFRKLSVEDNILAILETLPLSKAERQRRLPQRQPACRVQDVEGDAPRRRLLARCRLEDAHRREPQRPRHLQHHLPRPRLYPVSLHPSRHSQLLACWGQYIADSEG